MKLLTNLLLPALISTAYAISDAKVYIFQGEEFPNTSTPPALSPEEARLVFAQRLGVSEYHGLGDANENTLAYINQFGGPQELLFQGLAQDKAAELVLIVEGISSNTAESLLSAWSSIKPAFTISNPPSSFSTFRLIEDLQTQLGRSSQICPFEDTINPFEKKCWDGKAKIMHLGFIPGQPGIDDLISAQERLIKFAKNQEMNVIVVLMPEACQTIKATPRAYGSYEMQTQSSQLPLGRRQQAEEPMTEPGVISSSFPLAQLKQIQTSNSTEDPEPLLPVPAQCYTSLEACNNGTNSCSGHGECYKKTGKDGGRASCFACMCKPTEEEFLQGDEKNRGYRIIYWGGAACQKKDVSGPFWLIGIFTVVMVGLVSWAIGMLFSIGEEKLPGVIGAGVSSKQR